MLEEGRKEGKFSQGTNNKTETDEKRGKRRQAKGQMVVPTFGRQLAKAMILQQWSCQVTDG